MTSIWDIVGNAAANRFLDEVRAHVTLEPVGDSAFKGLCPVHRETTPSFYVHPKARMAVCFGCGETWREAELLRLLEHLRLIAERMG